MNRAQATDLIDRLFDSWYAVLLRQAYRLTGSFEVADYCCNRLRRRWLRSPG